ncbi:MAG: hypothetical protein HY361_01450 [Candidatus Aenigmarchaeota archaeon]|nr:hypothetical protein [Candidatus Aenigmarchaeota archaeon]
MDLENFVDVMGEQSRIFRQRLREIAGMISMQDIIDGINSDSPVYQTRGKFERGREINLLLYGGSLQVTVSLERLGLYAMDMRLAEFTGPEVREIYDRLAGEIEARKEKV